jgi:crotonobetainyl-CoA:carnitine CoA-transferase CaiB-like acyl-CoA transferase
MNQTALKEVRILDFGWVLAGPFATRLLADFGAEVIKVQPPLAEGQDKFSRSYYDNWNRNKLGITLDLSKPEGIDIARKLVSISDAVVENFSPRVLANWGLEYPRLQSLNPDIILLSLSAMGHDGPWKDYVAFGPTVQAFSGLTSLTAYPGGGPLGVGYSYSDHVAGLYGSLALLAALEYRRRTGLGQYIDLSQLETMTSFLAEACLGTPSIEAAPEDVYPCLGEDRWCAVSVTGEEEWVGFKTALGRPVWAEQSTFSSHPQRLQNKKALGDLISAWTREHSAERVMTILQKEGVPAGVVQNAADIARDPQLVSRRFFPDAQPFSLSGFEMKLNSSPARGQNNDYVYGQLLGMKSREISRLRDAGVI